jgi:hypothetical protein
MDVCWFTTVGKQNESTQNTGLLELLNADLQNLEMHCFGGTGSTRRLKNEYMRVGQKL